MGNFFKRSRKASFELFSSHECWTPSWMGFAAVLGLYAAGLLIAGSLTGIVSIFDPDNRYFAYIFPIAYILTYVPLYIFSAVKSSLNRGFTAEIPLDRNDTLRSEGTLKLIILCFLAIVGFIVVTDPLGYILPEPSKQFKQAAEIMSNGPFALLFISTCILAPFFEEWMCRGIVLRGLLHVKGGNGAMAIFISAIVFGVMHGNLDQGVPAFLAGCLLGFVYYKTGSLKLTMLMHFLNNFVAVTTSKIPGMEEVEHFYQLVDNPFVYWSIVCAGFAMLVLCVLRFLRIKSNEQEAVQESL